MAKCMDELDKREEAIAAYKNFIEKYPTDELRGKTKEHIEKLTALK